MKVFNSGVKINMIKIVILARKDDTIQNFKAILEVENSLI